MDRVYQYANQLILVAGPEIAVRPVAMRVPTRGDARIAEIHALVDSGRLAPARPRGLARAGSGWTTVNALDLHEHVRSAVVDSPADRRRDPTGSRDGPRRLRINGHTAKRVLSPQYAEPESRKGDLWMVRHDGRPRSTPTCDLKALLPGVDGARYCP